MKHWLLPHTSIHYHLLDGASVLTWFWVFYSIYFLLSLELLIHTINTIVQVKDERAQEKAKQILRDHGAKVAGGKVVAPITKAATKGKTAAVEATKPPTTTLLLTPNTTNTKDDVEMVIKTRPSFSSSSSPSEKKKKKAKTIQSKHHKRSTSSISTSSHKENGTLMDSFIHHVDAFFLDESFFFRERT